jgi:hypothetical protein
MAPMLLSADMMMGVPEASNRPVPRVKTECRRSVLMYVEPHPDTARREPEIRGAPVVDCWSAPAGRPTPGRCRTRGLNRPYRYEQRRGLSLAPPP